MTAGRRHPVHADARRHVEGTVLPCRRPARTPADRDALLLAIMGSGNPIQVDGAGGAHPLASKVPWSRVGQRRCRHRLSVPPARGRGGDHHGPAELREHPGRHRPVRRGARPHRRRDESTTTRIRMVNSGAVVTATFATPRGVPAYRARPRSPGPRHRAPILLRFADTAGSATGHLLPTGRLRT